MKKLLTIAAIAAAALTTLASCNKENGSGNGKNENTKTYRMTSYSNVGDGWEDKWVFTYNENGTLKEANRGDDDHDWIFTYNGSDVSVALKSGAVVYTMTLDAKGNATKIDDKVKGVVYTFTYDNAGYLISGKADGVAKTECSIQNGCILNWTRVGEEGWRYKDHTYDSAIKNIGGVHTSYSEDTGITRWIHEAGFMGKASAYVCLTAQWRDRDKSANYEYEYDKNGCIVKEIKYYDGALDATYAFTYEEVK